MPYFLAGCKIPRPTKCPHNVPKSTHRWKPKPDARRPGDVSRRFPAGNRIMCAPASARIGSMSHSKQTEPGWTAPRAGAPAPVGRFQQTLRDPRQTRGGPVSCHGGYIKQQASTGLITLLTIHHSRHCMMLVGAIHAMIWGSAARGSGAISFSI